VPYREPPKSRSPLKVAQKQALKGVKGKQRAALNKEYNAVRKACIKTAVEARQADQAPAPAA